MPYVPWRIINTETWENRVTWHTLVDIPQSPVRRRFAVPAVRRGAMIEDVGMCSDDLRKNAFIYITGRKIGLTEITCLISVIEFEIQRFRDLIICTGLI